MAAAANPDNRRDDLLESEEPFRTNAFLLILKALELSEDRPHFFAYVDEILHSIFFLGNINIPPYSPEDIVNIPEVFTDLRGTYPRPFKLFSSHLPRRSPFSCVLDMVVRETGEREERDIIRQLQNIVSEVDPSGSRELISAVICVSQRRKSPDLTKYYGVSMSTVRRKKILIGAACLSNWHPLVANAVMTYYPHKRPKDYFNGTFRLRPTVRCQAFDLSRQEERRAEEIVKPPCRSCGNLFGLATTDTKENPYGNCAEAESLSNLLKRESVLDIIQAQPENSEQSLRRATRQVENDLRFFLRWPQDSPITFYTPGIE